MQDLINTLAQFKEFMIISVALVLITLVIISLQLKKDAGFGLWFFTEDKRKVLMFPACFLQMTFVISCCIRYQPLTSVHVIFFIMLSILSVLTIPTLKLKAYSILNICLLGAGLFMMHALYQYSEIMRFPVSFLIIYILAAIVLSLYSIYVCLYELINVKERT